MPLTPTNRETSFGSCWLTVSKIVANLRCKKLYSDTVGWNTALFYLVGIRKERHAVLAIA